MSAAMRAVIANPAVPLLSGATVGGERGYVCARTWACTSSPELYDVRLPDGRIVKHLLRDQLSDLSEPDPDVVARVIR